MIEKIKSKLSAFTKGRQVRLSIAAFLTALAVASATLLNCSIHTIKIFDGHKTYTVRALNNNVTLAINSISLQSKDFEVLETETSDNITTVKISYNFPVYIIQGNKTTSIDFCGGTVKDALSQAGITPDEFDFIEPSLDTEITKSCYIDYTDINYIKTTDKETVPFDTQKVYSDKLTKGTEKVTTEGKDGINKVISTEKLVNGVSVQTTTKTVVVKEPVNKKVTVGTKVAKKTTTSKKGHVSTLSPKTEIELDENGVPVNYKSKMTVRATAYTHTGNRCSTGVKPQPGYIAVNPKIIPYGTKMFIKTTDGKYIYGYAVAADTGGFIKKHPTGVDLFFNSESECRTFGVRTAEIYILD